MTQTLDPTDRSLMDGWQRDFPLVSRPFAVIGRALSLPEADVIARLQRLTAAGMISRIGATCRPNTIAASTLAAMAVPEDRIEEVAAIVGREPGVNHSYLRENRWNLWFVCTGPDQGDLEAALARIAAQSRLQVLNLPLLHPFNIDLGFGLDGPSRALPARAPLAPLVPEPGDRALMQSMTRGLAIVARPFAALAQQLNQSEAQVIARTGALARAGYLNRVGVIVRHRALGWRSNAMVVWQVPVERVIDAGERLAAVPGVTLCYQRRPVAGVWPYTLYCMIHAQSRAAALAVLEQAAALPELAGVAHRVLFSTHCFKQTGALIAHPVEAAS